MKTIDAKTNELEFDTHVQGESVMDDTVRDEVMLEDETQTIQARALSAQLIASLATKNTSIISKKQRPLSERESGSIARL